MALPSNYHVLAGPGNLEIGFRGPDLSYGKLPAFFYLALSAEDSLCLDPFCQPVNFLLEKTCRVFSFTLPGHGVGQDKTKAMGVWAEQFSNSINIVENFVLEVLQNIDFLIEKGYIESENLSIAGLSRGGFLALHLAARDQRFTRVLGFAPLIELYALSEISKFSDDAFVKSLSLDHCVNSLSNCSVRFYIGNRDKRVGTGEAYQFLRRLIEKAYEKGIRSPPMEMIIYPSIGYKGHGTLPHIFKKGAQWLENKDYNI